MGLTCYKDKVNSDKADNPLSLVPNNFSEMKSEKDGETVPREGEKDIIDKALQYGKYQSLLIWIFGTSIGMKNRFS